MGFQGVMGYGVEFPAYQIGGSKMLWDKRGYGLSEVWVMRESTVHLFAYFKVSSSITRRYNGTFGPWL